MGKKSSKVLFKLLTKVQSLQAARDPNSPKFAFEDLDSKNDFIGIRSAI